jgi:lipoate-protein ligase A
VTPAGEDAALGIEPYAHDDALVTATRADGRARVAIYPFPEIAVVLGRGSDAEAELILGRVRADGVRVLRRRGGGCAVVLDPGNVIVTVALAIPGLGEIRSTFDALTRWLIAGLERAGVEGVRSDGVSDLVTGDRKVAGSCVHRALGLFIFSASLLVAPDVAHMSRYLAHPPREPGYRRGRAHAAFVASIAEHWSPPGSRARADVAGGVTGAPNAATARAFAESLTHSLAPVEHVVRRA